jgi:capsular polysaccharide biosynthesis protein
MANSKNSAKNLIVWAILIGAIFAAIAFAYSMFLSRYWQVTGKIVIVPSGTSATAGQNLYLEAGNTAEIVNSPSFKKNILGDGAKNFDRVESIKNSSTVAVIFLAKEADVKAAEDVIVTFPEKIATHTRDLYNGAPFKYILVSDPEVSASPVKPDVYKNIIWGFLAGVIISFLYWISSEAFRTESLGTEEKIYEEKPIVPDLRPVIAPTIKPEIEKVPEPEIFSAPEKKTLPEVIITPRDMQNVAPSNLPIADEDETPAATQEPSDEEVKDRLNRLMRGEL